MLTLSEAMADWIADVSPRGNPFNWSRNRLITYVETHYTGGLRQFIDDSPDITNLN